MKIKVKYNDGVAENHQMNISISDNKINGESHITEIIELFEKVLKGMDYPDEEIKEGFYKVSGNVREELTDDELDILLNVVSESEEGK